MKYNIKMWKSKILALNKIEHQLYLILIVFLFFSFFFFWGGGGGLFFQIFPTCHGNIIKTFWLLNNQNIEAITLHFQPPHDGFQLHI